MRIWDIEPQRLCRQHLLGEHRELHGLWNILTKHGGQGGYSSHPETVRWVGRQAALLARHNALADEIERRGYEHNSDLDSWLARGTTEVQDQFLSSQEEQLQILRNKGCSCNTEE